MRHQSRAKSQRLLHLSQQKLMAEALTVRVISRSIFTGMFVALRRLHPTLHIAVEIQNVGSVARQNEDGHDRGEQSVTKEFQTAAEIECVRPAVNKPASSAAALRSKYRLPASTALHRALAPPTRC